MKTSIATEQPGRDPTGWHNFCGTCGRRYWVRASDQSQTKVRRFVSPESDERHQCQPSAVDGR